MRPREFLPRSFLDLPSAGDDEAIVGRGPNILLRDRRRLLAKRHRLRLDQPVGRDQPNEPSDVAAVETVLKQTGDLDFRRESEPTGLFSRTLLDAVQNFQRRRNLEVDGVVRPDGETVRGLEDESFAGEAADERRREVICVQNRVQLDNLQIAIDEATEGLLAANAAVVALSEEADRFNARLDGQLAITAISAAVPAVLAIRAGLGIVAALREFARGAMQDTPQLAAAQSDAGDLATRFENAISKLEFENQQLEDLLGERKGLLQTRAGLRCS